MTSDPRQYRHLADEEKAKKTAFRYGSIRGRFVLYRGEDKDEGNIRYLNVEAYLKSLSNR